MPRFLDTKNPALSSLNEAKKKVNKLNIKRFQTGEREPQKEFNLKDTDGLFEVFVAKLQALYQSVFEFTTVVQTASKSATSNEGVADRALGATSALVRQGQDLIGFFDRQLNNSVRRFSEKQVRLINELIEQIQGLNDEIDDLISTDFEGAGNRVLRTKGATFRGLYDTFSVALQNFCVSVLDSITSYNTGAFSDEIGNPIDDGSSVGSWSTASSGMMGRGHVLESSSAKKISHLRPDLPNLPRRFV